MKLDPGTIAAVLTIGTIVVAAISAAAARLLERRRSSGKVATSEAAVLWEQAQDMRHSLMEDKRRAEEQRDRLIEAYTQQLFPALTTITQLVKDLSGTVAAVFDALQTLAPGLQEGGGHAPSPSSPRP